MHELLDQLELLIADVQRTPLAGAEPAALTQMLARLEQLSRRMDAVSRSVLAEVDRRGVAGDYGACSTRDLLRQVLRISAREAAARVRRAAELTPRVGLTGQVLPPLFPEVAAALEKGAISLAHAHVITATRSALPAAVDATHGDAAESFLVEQAKRLDPTQLGHAARRLADTLDPDGTLTEHADHQRRRHFTLVQHCDGSATPTGRLTPELNALLRPILDCLSAPKAAGDLPDTRTGGQRRHDAIIEAATRLLRSGTLPDAGGVPVSIVVTVSRSDLQRAQQGHSVLVEDAYGTPISLETVASISAEIELAAVTLNTAGGILSYGRTRRLASCAQRRALAVRDKGCAFPGCTRPPAWCEAHHINEWLRGGQTSLDNLVLLCRHHHRNFHAAGWTIRINPAGIPEWTPPAWLDPEQRPRRNTAHDQPLMPALDPSPRKVLEKDLVGVGGGARGGGARGGGACGSAGDQR